MAGVGIFDDLSEGIGAAGRYLDPTAAQGRDPDAEGENERGTYSEDPEVGARAIQLAQPDLEGHSIGGFFSNLLDNVKEFAQGSAHLITYPIAHPVNTAEALIHPIDTAETIGGALVQNYKQAYTPQPNESIPGMILRRLYEKPVDTLMDASLLGQAAFGGAGLATRIATAGTRGLAEGAEAAGRIGDALKLGSGVVGPDLAAAGEIGADAESVARRAATANKYIDLFDSLSERAKRLDPLSIAQDIGGVALKTTAPDLYAAWQSTKQMTDATAARNAQLLAVDAQQKRMTTQAFAHLNDAEKLVVQPYIEGRVNFDRPVGEQLINSTGQWVPIKGDVIRPDALEQARQNYIPIQQWMLQQQGRTTAQVAETAGIKAANFAREQLGDKFDPLDPVTSDFVQKFAQSAVQQNNEYLKSRALGTMRTALDIGKEKEWERQIESMVADNTYATAKDAAANFPRPQQTTPEEALALMGPQGGIYFPHSAESGSAAQSTIAHLLTKFGEASTFKENTYALFRSGFIDNNDPIKAVQRALSTYNKGQSWQSIAQDAVEKSVAMGTGAQVMEKGWNPNLDADVIARTHQPWSPGDLMTDSMVTEDLQHMLTRGLETSAESGDMNMMEMAKRALQGAEDGPMYKPRADAKVYKIPTAMGHAIDELKDAHAPVTNPLFRTLDSAMGYWNWGTLNLRATRLINRVTGHSLFAAMQGVHPFSVQGASALVATGRALLGAAGLGGEREAQLAKVFDLPGIRTGGLETSLLEASGGVGGRLAASDNPVARFFGKGSNVIANTATNIDAAFRAASLFYELSPNSIGRVQRMMGHMAAAPSLGETIERFSEAGGDVMKLPEFTQALKGVNRYFGDYNRQTPLERKLVRRITPYYQFIKHSTELFTRYPFEHPLMGAGARALGQAVTQDLKDQVAHMGFNWDTDVKDYLKDGIPIQSDIDGETGQKRLLIMPTKVYYPFSHLTGNASEEMINSIAPWLRIAIEQTTGVNLFKKEKYRGAISSFDGQEVDEHTGEIKQTFTHPSVGEAVLRQFWPYNMVKDLVANGRIPTDTADLIDMATNAPGAWQYDQRGLPSRKPQYGGTANPLLKLLGRAPTYVTEPTDKQLQKRKATTNSQLNTLYQRYSSPQQRDLLQAKVDQANAEEDARQP